MNKKGKQTRPNHHLPEALKQNQWKKGQSGNPKGRPIGSTCSITSELKKLLLEKDGERIKELAKKWFEMARNGDTTALKELLDRVEGKVLQKVENTWSFQLELSQEEQQWLMAMKRQMIESNEVSLIEHKDIVEVEPMEE